MSRFAIFGLNYAPEPTGNGPYTAAYARALAAAGHDVTVVTGYQHYPAWTAEHRRWRWSTESEAGDRVAVVRVIRVPHAVPSTLGVAGRFQLEATYGLASLPAMALLGRVDAAIGVVPSLSGGVAARVAGMLRRRPVGLLVQDLMSAAAAQGGVPGSSGRVAGAVGAVERRIVRGARVATVARGFQAPLEAMGAAAVTYLPNFTTMPPGDNRPVAETRERLGIPHGAFVVGYSGNLGYKQDFETVIAAARLLHHDPSCLFLFVGEGSQRALIDASIQSGDIHGLRLPLQPSDQAFDLLRACDLLLAPQRATDLDMSVPSKLTAYLAAGRPVLAAASAHSETADQVRRSGGGSVIDPGDPVLLARTIQELRAEPSRLEVMGATGRRHAECEFTRQAAEVRFVEWAESLR